MRMACGSAPASTLAASVGPRTAQLLKADHTCASGDLSVGTFGTLEECAANYQEVSNPFHRPTRQEV